MDSDKLRSMDLRLERIEQAIETLGKARGTKEVSLSEADVEAYHRVREALWEEGTCGINETSPCVISCIVVDKICKIVPIPKPCDVECTCGPCNIFDDFAAIRSGLARFGRLGR